jgi:SAM-dependent methyltransferase
MLKEIEKNYKDAKLYLKLGNTAYKNNDWEQAMWWYTIATKCPNVNYIVWDKLSMAAYHLKEKQQAAAAARKALQFKPPEKESKRIKTNLRFFDPMSVNADPEYYDEIWAKNPYPRSLEKLRIELMANSLNEEKPRRILDVGAGPGWILDHLNYEAHYCGVDFSSYARKIIKEKGGHAAESLDHVNEFDWDACILGEVLEHVDDDLALLGKIQGKLVPNSLLIVSVPRYGKMIDPAHVRDYTIEELEGRLRIMGEPERVEHNLDRWEIYKVKVKLPGASMIGHLGLALSDPIGEEEEKVDLNKGVY